MAHAYPLTTMIGRDLTGVHLRRPAATGLQPRQPLRLSMLELSGLPRQRRERKRRDGIMASNDFSSD